MTDSFGKLMNKVGLIVTNYPNRVLLISALIVTLGVSGAWRLQVDEAWIINFKQSEPIYIADKIINEKMHGTYYLDVVVETPEMEGLLNPASMRKVEQLQAFLESQPHVNGTTSYVDYLKQINKAFNENKQDQYAIPNDANLAAQYLVLHSAAGGPDSIADQIDYDYKTANIRAMLDSGFYSDGKIVVEQLQSFITKNFNSGDIQATISGQVAVSYDWISQLSISHFRGLFAALVFVWIMAAVSFRSVVAGILAVVPVTMSVLLLYAVMGYAGIWLSVGTSMFAAISIGVGVDFAIHTIDRLIVLIKQQGLAMREAFQLLFPSTGRALLFNFAAVFFGFGVLITSQVPPIVRFGALVAVAVSASFLASMIILPALVTLLKPRFLVSNAKQVAAHITEAEAKL